jgi:hypothetical protein
LVYGADREGDRLLGSVLGCGDNREAAGPRRMESLPLGGATIPTTMSPIDGSSYLMTSSTCRYLMLLRSSQYCPQQ